MLFNKKNINYLSSKLEFFKLYMSVALVDLSDSKQSIMLRSIKVLENDFNLLKHNEANSYYDLIKLSEVIYHSIRTVNFLIRKANTDTAISSHLSNRGVSPNSIKEIILTKNPSYSMKSGVLFTGRDSDYASAFDFIISELDGIKDLYKNLYIELNNNVISFNDPNSKEQFQLTKEYIRNLFTEQIEDISESIQLEVNERSSLLNEKMEGMGRFLDEVRAGLDSESSRISDQNKSAIESIKASGNNQVNDIRKKLSEFQISLEKQLESKESNLSTALESKVDNAIDSRMADIKGLNTLIEDSYNKADAEYKAFRTLYEEMKEMYQIAGKGELQRYNLEQAGVEKKEADRLRKYGAIAMLFPIAVAGAIFYDLVFAKPDFTLGWVMTRFLTLSIFSMPMLYALKESANHRYRENLYRQRGTQLATLGSYLDDFDLERKIALKAELAKNFYSVNTGKADTSHIPDPTAQIKEVAALSKSLSKIIPTQPIMYPKHNHQETPISVHLQPDNPTPEKGEDGKPRALNGNG